MLILERAPVRQATRSGKTAPLGGNLLPRSWCQVCGDWPKRIARETLRRRDFDVSIEALGIGLRPLPGNAIFQTAVANLRSFFRDIFGWVLVPVAIRSLRRQAAQIRTPEQALSLAFGFRSCGIAIAPGQNHSEIIQLLNVLAKEPPRYVLEIGTAGGGTFFLFARVAADNARLISADLPGAMFGGGYPRWRGKLIQSFARLGQEVSLLRVDSHQPETLERIQGLLRGNPLDFLFIDGDHRYEGVKADFETYSPLVRKGGWIGFHDIVPGPAHEAGGVAVFWQELKKRHAVQEFVQDWKQSGYGIGLLRKGD
jgi:predicted O-methyltransferase YrrM